MSEGETERLTETACLKPSNTKRRLQSSCLEIPELTPEPTLPDAPYLTSEPVALWGSVARDSVVGVWLFYVDDYRFERLARYPEQLIGTCGEAGEVNFSTFDATPYPVALHQTYRKRVLSTTWQTHGIQVWVDLCVAARHSLTNLVGVPRGWQRYCTAGFDSRVSDLDGELLRARRHADGAPFGLVVYGGGKLTREWCGRVSKRCRKNVIQHVPRRAIENKFGEGTRVARMKRANNG